MSPMFIPARIFSRAFWASMERFGRAPIETMASCEKNREYASSDSGTVSPQDAIALWRLARCFSPATIAEVGTFIGTSTVALRVGSGAQVFTCDKDNKCFEMDGVETFHETSTEMFKKLKARGIKIEMFFIDGRLNPEDVDLIKDLKTDNSVFVFDDYEGIEKGVLNVALLASVLKGNIFMQPLDAGLAASVPYHMIAVKGQ